MSISLKLDLASLSNRLRIAGMLLLFLNCSCGVARSQDVNDKLVSKCFFIYAGVLEAAETTNSAALFYYAQKRIGWAAGYLEAKKNDSVFQSVFDRDLEQNKSRAIQIRESIIKAIRNGDNASFTDVMQAAQRCDIQLGLPVEAVTLP